ncbi:glycosyltransferase family 2 protein [Vibrio cholerae]
MENVTIVIPTFNESFGVILIYNALISTLKSDRFTYEVLFVDDGSSDNTVDVIKSIAPHNKFNISLLELSRNYGHQIALRAGYIAAKGDVIICMDADLQHPPQIVNVMLDKYISGSEIVCAIRDDSFVEFSFKKKSSEIFYKIWSWLTDINLEPGSSDFRLLSRRILNEVNSYSETYLFIRGLIPQIGYSIDSIYYKPNDREYGVSKYNLKKMLSLSKNGILWGSIKPLRLASILAFMTALMAIIFGFYSIFTYFFVDGVVPGWSSTMTIISLVGSLQLFAIGIVGEYLGQVLQEVRKRPLYHVKQTYSSKYDD